MRCMPLNLNMKRHRLWDTICGEQWKSPCATLPHPNQPVLEPHEERRARARYETSSSIPLSPAVHGLHRLVC